MIFLKRKRYIYWLLRAYIKRWGKIIFSCLAVGILLAILLFFNRKYLFSILPNTNTETIGIAGDFPEDDFPNNLPEEIVSKTSRGLTKVLPNGEVAPDIAKRWANMKFFRRQVRPESPCKIGVDLEIQTIIVPMTGT